jgi:hypothetical protein
MIERVLAAWQTCPGLHTARAGASEEVIDTVETALGRALPACLRELYRFSDGGHFLEGNLTVEPLRGSKEFEGLDRLTADFDARGPGVPDELLVFGGNGSDALFSLWLPPGGEQTKDAPVIASDMGPESMTLAGTGLAPFLVGWSAYYLLVCEAPAMALDELGLPDDLRTSALDEQHFAAIVAWADPDLPNPAWDIYETPATPDELRATLPS